MLQISLFEFLVLSTPCQSHHCHRNGFCSVPYGSQAVCTCTVGSTGPYCKNGKY